MRNPYLDWHKLKWHFMQFQIAPEHLLELKPVELAHLLLYVEQQRREYAVDLNDLLRGNPGTGIKDHSIFSPELVRLENAVKAEQQRRSGESVTHGQPEPTTKKKYKPKEEKVLPERLADVVNDPDMLLTLFEKLRGMQEVDNRDHNIESEPDFNSDGYIGAEDRNRGPLMGLMDALKINGQIKKGFTASDAYKIYCTELKIHPSGEPNRARNQELYKQIRRITMTFFEKHAKKEA
jgi:hypothetical protein